MEPKGKHRSQGSPASGAKKSASEETGQPRARVRLPGFVKDEEIGLGDVITRATYSVGIRPCGGCGRRAAALNRWVAFIR